MHFATTGSRALLLALLALLCSVAGARAATVTEFSDGISLDSRPLGITAGPDGNMWFTEHDGDQIGRITPSGTVTEFEISAGSGPTAITSGPDGNLWFTESDAGRIGRMTPAGVLTEFSAGITPGSGPGDIVTGADGNLWYTDHNGRRVGRITPAGVVTEFSVDTGIGGGPQSITAGADGNLWFTQFTNSGGRMTPAGVLTRFPSLSGQGIASAPDGSLWTTAYFGPIRRMTTAGVLTGTFALPPYVSPYGIAATADGNIWFADAAYDSIGRVTPSGAVALVIGGITPGSDPRDIAVGPDGNLWFTEPGLDQIGRVTPTIDPALVAVTDATAITTTSATLNGTIDARSLDTEARFEWGTTTAYGNQTVVQDVDSSSALPLSAAVANLRPATTYHYRLIATNGAGSVQSGDRTFTTAANPLPPPRPACSNGIDDDRDGFADRDDPRCHSDADRRNARTYRPLTATEAPVDNPVLACSSGGLALVSVELGSGRRIRLRGIADPAQAGRRVAIHAKGRRVANARVQPDGSFAASFRAAGRSAALGRYQARLGTRRSQSVAVQRRLANIVLQASSGTVTLSGRTVGRRPRSVELLGRAGGCGSFKRLATVRVGATGRFTLSAAAFGDLDIATYRVRIAAQGAAGQHESTPPRAVALR